MDDVCLIDNNLAQAAAGDLLQFLGASGYHFVTPTPLTHSRVNTRRAAQGRLQAKRLEDAFGWNWPFRGDLLPQKLMEELANAKVVTPAGTVWCSRVRVSSLGDALFAHSSFPTKDAEAVFFGPDTYRFAAALRRMLGSGRRVVRAVDVGCGSGAAGVLIARARPEAEVLMSDVNLHAVALATVNARAAGVDNAQAIYSDILEDLAGDFDLIVSNPPYMMDPARRRYRDGGDLLGAALSLRILEQALSRLRRGGACLLYTGSAIVEGRDTFYDACTPHLTRVGVRWTYEELDPDVFGEELDQPAYAQVDRIGAVALFATRE